MNKFYNVFHFAKVNGFNESKDDDEDNDDGPWIDDHTTYGAPG